MLQRPCRKFCKPQGKANLRRVFQEGKHPAHDLDLPEPWLWRHCAPAQEQPYVEKSRDNDGDAVYNIQSSCMKSIVQRLSSEHEHGRLYKSTDADDVKYKDAVAGDRADGIQHFGHIDEDDMWKRESAMSRVKPGLARANCKRTARVRDRFNIPGSASYVDRGASNLRPAGIRRR